MPPRRQPGFNVGLCVIPSVWCGNGPVPHGIRDNTRYTRVGTTTECMRKGIGAGMAQERLKNVPEDSLQRIKYVGEVYERNLIRERIRTQTALRTYARNHTNQQLQALLRRCFTKNGGGGVDMRAYNSTILWLYHQGIVDLPPCVRIAA